MANALFDALNLLARTQSLSAGAVLFRRNEPSGSVYVVRRGRIALLWPDTEEAVPMELVGAGSIIGLPAALNGAYSVTAQTIIDSEVGTISAGRVVELLESHPALCQIATKLMAQEVARMRSSLTEHCSEVHHESEAHS